MAHLQAQSGTTDSGSHLRSRGRTKSPAPRPNRRAQSPTLTAGVLLTLNGAGGAVIPCLSSDLACGIQEAARQARGPKSILHRLLAFEAGHHGGRLGLTHEEIFNTVASILGTAMVAAHGILRIGVALLDFSPIPGLAGVGKALLNIWTTFEEVGENRDACEQLAEECTVIVSFLREEVFIKDGFRADDMRDPLAQLTMALEEAEIFVKEQRQHTHAHDFVTHRADKRRVESIRNRVTQAFAMFNYLIPIHTFRSVMQFLKRQIPEQESSQVAAMAAPLIVTVQPPPYQPSEARHPPENIISTTPPTIYQPRRPTVVEVTRVHDYDSCRREHRHTPPQNNPTNPPAAQPSQAISNRQPDIPRLYARLVQHDFNESLPLTMPLWTPTPVHIGAVGYWSRTDGSFVTLFNVRAPPDFPGIPALECTGPKDTKSVSYTGRPHTFDLQADLPVAYFYTEKTMYRCFINLEKPENWLLENADKVIARYRGEHPIDRKRLMLVTGTMAAQNYALCVCPTPPKLNSEISFHRHKAKPGQPWGKWSQKPEADGAEPIVSKISTVKAAHEPWDVVLLSVMSYHFLMEVEGVQ